MCSRSQVGWRKKLKSFSNFFVCSLCFQRELLGCIHLCSHAIAIRKQIEGSRTGEPLGKSSSPWLFVCRADSRKHRITNKPSYTNNTQFNKNSLYNKTTHIVKWNFNFSTITYHNELLGWDGGSSFNTQNAVSGKRYPLCIKWMSEHDDRRERRWERG